MSDHMDCKHYDDCNFRNDVGWCPESCRQYKHKDDVRVVRCKDCKHHNETWCDMNSRDRGEWFCWHDDDFCSYGERRNDA